MPHVGGTQTKLLQAGAVHLQIHHRAVQALVHMGIDRAGYFLDCARQLRCQIGVAHHICARKLHVNGGRQTEVQNLRRNVSRLEEELHIRKALGQFVAQLGHKYFGRCMAVLQRHQDLGVHGADGAGIAVRQIDTTVGQADVVQNGVELILGNHFTDHAFDRIGDAGSLFDSSARGGAHVQTNLPRVNTRKEVTAQKRVNQTGKHAKAKEQSHEAAAVRQGRRDGQGVDPAHPFKLSVKAAVDPLQQTGFALRCSGVIAAHQHHHQGGHQGPRQEVRSDHGQDHSFGQGHKQKPRNAR